MPPDPLTQQERLVKNFIENLYDQDKKCFQVFGSPGAFEWAKANNADDAYDGNFLDLFCDCNCSGKWHEHMIFMSNTNDERLWRNLKIRAHRKLKRVSGTFPGKLTFGPHKNRAHLMNKVLYLLTADSKNYSFGFTIIKKNGHKNHRNQFGNLVLTQAEATAIRDVFREEDEEIDDDMKKNSQKRAAQRARCKASKKREKIANSHAS